MSAAHTPGPWMVSESDPARVDVRDEFDEYSFAIASCRVPLVAPNPEEITANARLIAAAPELYEALQELASEVATAGLSLALLDRLDASHSKARAALAKARGEA